MASHHQHTAPQGKTAQRRVERDRAGLASTPATPRAPKEQPGIVALRETERRLRERYDRTCRALRNARAGYGMPHSPQQMAVLEQKRLAALDLWSAARQVLAVEEHRIVVLVS